ncbi:thioredoxin [Corynebacterium mustelae]|uniref:Thioredoxin n=1 Tax=Corynebacterium mustelae TaxID=571915 RepID=A0A0G3H1T2_9CORY|nr:thioredoxin [Corynebacterium mustelae]AKK07371.1 thioredoxin [Corynebacterium mustelae]
MSIVTITEQNFRTEVVESDKPVLVDFWAEWCGPCKKLNPVIEEIAAEYSDKLVVGKVNVDQERNLAAMFQVMSIPTLIVYKNGELVDQFLPGRNKQAIVAKFENHL